MPGEFDFAFDAFGAIHMLLLTALNAVIYVFQALSLYTIARRRNISKPWMAWIPLLNLWIMGSLSDQFQQYTKNKVTNRRKLLIGLYLGAVFGLVLLVTLIVILASLARSAETAVVLVLISVVVGYLAIVGMLIAMVVFQYMVLYDIFASCNPKNATAYLVISIFFSVAMPFLLFSCRNQDGGMISYQQKQWQMQQQYQAWQAQQFQAQQAWAAQQQAWQAQQQAQQQAWQAQQQAQQRRQQEQDRQKWDQ